MAHTIVTDVCEGIADCVDACPVACIDQGKGKNQGRKVAKQGKTTAAQEAALVQAEEVWLALGSEASLDL